MLGLLRRSRRASVVPGHRREFVVVACGEAEFAVQTNDRFGTANLATINVHVREAESNLTLARQELVSELDEID
jgi:hypothetical protein